MRARREHGDLLSFGNGATSVARAYDLVKRLMEAFEVMSGIQQPCMSTDQPETEESLDSRNHGAYFVHCVAEDIFVALTGEEVTETVIADWRKYHGKEKQQAEHKAAPAQEDRAERSGQGHPAI